MHDLLSLFFIFFRIGLFSIGGVHVMLPMMKKELVEKIGWLTNEEILNYYAIGQATPGIIAVNIATFTGYKKNGIIGSIIATFGIVFPSLVIITIIAAFFSKFNEIPIIQKALSGIRVSVAVLLLFIIFDMIKNGIKNIFGWIVMILAFLFITFLKMPAVIIVVASAMAGIIAGYFSRNIIGKKE